MWGDSCADFPHSLRRGDEPAPELTVAGSNSAVKNLLLATFHKGLEQQMEIEGRLISAGANSADGREGIDAFLNKRPHRFT